MPLWYVVRGGEIWAWTYAKSQKVHNLEREATGPPSRSRTGRTTASYGG